MQKHVEEIEIEIVQKIHKVFLIKFNKNKSHFAESAQCSETTVRRVFRNEQRMTLNLLLRFCITLDLDINEVFEGINVLNFKSTSI
jgi:DNA-binding Xre family transcriptional regulator